MTALNTDEIGASEKKRLESLKQKKEAFRAKELAVQNALRNLDSKSSKNKIIFDDDIDKIEQPKSTGKEKKKKRKRDLFDNEDNNENDDNDTDWNAKFEFNKNVTGKFKPNITLGNDERFKLDDRFTEEDQKSDENVATESIDETSNLQKEKELQLDILENILGVPIVSKNKDANKDEKIPKKGMIRYDPTESNHKEYEINTDKLEEETKKVKKKKKAKDSVEDANENPPVEVSKEVFFSVSDSLSKSLKEGGQFSLLKAYGKATEDDKVVEEDKKPNTEASKPAKFQFDINSKNPFKYDSSDDERDDKKEVLINEEPSTNDVIEDTGKLFFDINDVRFNEAIKFFSKERAPQDAFKELRRELKQIVRSKIRRNVKKKQPWGYKKKVKRS